MTVSGGTPGCLPKVWCRLHTLHRMTRWTERVSAELARKHHPDRRHAFGFIFPCAHRCFSSRDSFLRAAALMRPRLLRVAAVVGGRPALLRPVESRPSMAAIARLIRSRSARISARILLADTTRTTPLSRTSRERDSGRFPHANCTFWQYMPSLAPADRRVRSRDVQRAAVCLPGSVP